jgi:hypothetical protein
MIAPQKRPKSVLQLVEPPGGKGKGGQGGSYVEGAQQLEETASSGGRSAAAEQLAAQVEGMTLKEEPSPPDHQQLSESKQR